MQSVIGFGLNVIAVPALVIFFNPQTSVTVLSLASTLNCIWLVWQIKRSGDQIDPQISRLLPLLVMASIGTLIGGSLLVILETSVVLVFLGVFLLVFVATDHWRRNWRPSPQQETSMAYGVGLVSGIMQGLTAIAGPTLIPYLHTLKLDKNQFVYYLNVIFVFIGFIQLMSLAILNLYTPDRVLLALSLVPVSFSGISIGNRLRPHVQQEYFNILIYVVLTLTALDLLRRGLHINLF